MAALTQRQLEDLFWRATILCLGLDPDDPGEAVQKRVRVSWPQSDTGNSTWDRDENVVFLRIAPTPDDYSQLRDIEHVYDGGADILSERVTYHRAFTASFICYGPDSLEDADRIKIGILRDSVHSVLKAQGVAVQPAIREPLRLTEPDESGDWWERYDLSVSFYALTSREYAEEMITSLSDAGTVVTTN